MMLVVGLGNPGTRYKNNRHNAGFIVVDELASRLGAAWEYSKKLRAETSRVKTPQGKEYLLLKPQTFMNESGEAVSRALAFFSSRPTDLLVVHDDVDLEALQFKVSANSSSAGHHGVQNVIDRIGTQDFTRLRIGVGRPMVEVGSTERGVFDVEKYVLQDFSSEQLENIKKQGIEHLLSSLSL